MKIQIFDPPMCCSTGVCGPAIDPEMALVRFAADVDWLKGQGVDVERFNLSQQPAAFVNTPVVKELLTREGEGCLPLVVVNGAVVARGEYPKREVLAGFAGIVTRPSIFTAQVKELVAIGAAIASNCEPCFKYHYNEARKLDVSKEDMRLAVEMAQQVKDSPARSVLALAEKHLTEAAATTSPCCSGTKSTAAGSKCCG